MDEQSVRRYYGVANIPHGDKENVIRMGVDCLVEIAAQFAKTNELLQKQNKLLEDQNLTLVSLTAVARMKR